jgi:hypothetical protein
MAKARRDRLDARKRLRDCDPDPGQIERSIRDIRAARSEWRKASAKLWRLAAKVSLIAAVTLSIACGHRLNIHLDDASLRQSFRSESEPILTRQQAERARGNWKTVCELENELLTVAKKWCNEARRLGVDLTKKNCSWILTEKPLDCDGLSDTTPEADRVAGVGL